MALMEQWGPSTRGWMWGYNGENGSPLWRVVMENGYGWKSLFFRRLPLAPAAARGVTTCRPRPGPHAHFLGAIKHHIKGSAVEDNQTVLQTEFIESHSYRI